VVTYYQLGPHKKLEPYRVGPVYKINPAI